MTAPTEASSSLASKVSKKMRIFLGFLLLLLVAGAITFAVLITSTTERKIKRIIKSEFQTVNEQPYQRLAFDWLVHFYKRENKDIKKGMEKEILEKYTLLSIYYSTEGFSPEPGDSRLSSENICSWYGVKCANNEMTELRLRNNNLKGSIPDEIKFLRSLTALDISNNEIQDVSTEIASLPSLTTLWLHRNNALESIPKEVNELMTKLPKIQEYAVTIFEDKPMSKSRIFEYGRENSQFQAFQTVAHRLDEGDDIDFGGSLWQRYVLNVIYFNTNGDGLIYGPSDGWRVDTWMFRDDYCRWNGVECNSNEEVVELDLENNSLRGRIPAELGVLSTLTSLTLSLNSLKGTIPTEIGNLTELRYLYFNYMDLIGSIPTEIGELAALELLHLRGNKLTGSIPSQLGALTKLAYVILKSDSFTGTIPTELGNMAALSSLIIDSTQLTGSIPTEFRELTALEVLEVPDNELTGSIPSQIGALTKLWYLNIGGNSFTGRIPTEIGILTALGYLLLGGNQLTGSIPTEIGELAALKDLNLGYNRMTGAIPTEIGELSAVEYLGLDNSQLTGAIPSQIENLANLTELYLHNNTLSGSLPEVLCDNTYYLYIDCGEIECDCCTDSNLDDCPN